jgi:hypothetical protein
MKIIGSFIAIAFFLTSCNHGIWLSQNSYRPKHPKFSILKGTFQGNALLNNTNLYVSTKKFINYDGKILVGYMGFYDDGRIILDNAFEKDIPYTLSIRNSFKTASVIGYYTTAKETIKFEYFTPGDGGHYEIKQGVIKKDTIILSETFNLLFKKKLRSDTLVKSLYILK